MIILQLSHGLALISSCTDQKEAISAKEFSSSRFKFLFSQKTLQSNLSWLHIAFSSSLTLKERLSKDISSLTSESESKAFLEDLPIRHILVKSPCLHLTFSSSSELEEYLLEKLKSLKATHTLGHDLLELIILLLISEVFLLLVVAFVAIVISVGVLVLVGGVKFLPLGTVGDEVDGVAVLEAALG
jgi:hypothetical protein